MIIRSTQMGENNLRFTVNGFFPRFRMTRDIFAEFTAFGILVGRKLQKVQ